MLTMFPSLIENVASRASDFGLSVIEHRPTCSCALHFDYGLKVRPFFPKLIEPMDVRLDAMSSQGVDHQVLSAWADIFDHGMPRQNAVAWHSYLNNHLAKVCELRPERFSLLASVPFPFAQESAAELERAVIKLGAVGAVIAANVEGTILGNLRLQEKLTARDNRHGPLAAQYALQSLRQPRSRDASGTGGAGDFRRRRATSWQRRSCCSAFPAGAFRTDRLATNLSTYLTDPSWRSLVLKLRRTRFALTGSHGCAHA